MRKNKTFLLYMQFSQIHYFFHFLSTVQYRHDYEKREAYTRCRMKKWEAFCIRNADNFFFIITNTIIFIVMYSIARCVWI